MKIIKYVPIPILVFGMDAGAKPAVGLSPTVSAFHADFFSGKTSNHRSGTEKPELKLFKDSDAPSEFPSGFDKVETAKDALDWHRKVGEEYAVSFDDGQPQIQAWLDERFKSWNFRKREYDTSDSCHVFAAAEDSLNRFKGAFSRDSQDVVMRMALRLAKQALESFKGRIEYENVETEYTNGKITSLNLRFRRIFKNAIVRGNLSYVYVVVDGAGELREIRVKWPRFEKLGGWYEAVPPEAVMAYAKTRMAEMPDLQGEKGVHHPVKSEGTSMAAVWVPLEEDGKITLSPGMSVFTDVAYDNGEVLHLPVDSPLLKKYHEGK